MTSRYQHMTTELMTSIADQIGGFFWADEAEDEDGEDGSAACPVVV